MYRLIYSIISNLANPVLRIIMPFNRKVRQFCKQRDKAAAVRASKRKYWIHCASLGEYEMALPLIEVLLEDNSPDDLIITFFSPSGYEIACRSPLSASMMYLPLDKRSGVKQFYRDYRPEYALFIRYDLWYNYIFEGLKGGIRFYLVNARFGEDHFIFKGYGKPYLRLLKQFSAIFCSDDRSVENLKASQCSNALYTGDTRFDRVIQNRETFEEIPAISSFKGDDKLLVLGSSWPEEEALLETLLDKQTEGLKMLIAPHDISESRIREIEERFSRYEPRRWSDQGLGNDSKILIINTIGILSKVYHYADFALIGGGFSGKLHNILEPAVFGAYICFGPKVEKFPEALLFEEEGFAYRIRDAQDWCNQILHLVKHREEAEHYRASAIAFVERNRGATRAVVKGITNDK